MHDQFNGLLAKDSTNCFLVTKISLIKGNFQTNCGSMPEDKIIEDNGAMPCRNQLTHTMATYVAGSTNN